MDILDTYPVGSMVVWKRKMWQDAPHYVPALVLGKVAGQGNTRLALRVASIKTTQIGRVLFTVDKPNVMVKNIMSLSQYYELRNSGII